MRADGSADSSHEMRPDADLTCSFPSFSGAMPYRWQFLRPPARCRKDRANRAKSSEIACLNGLDELVAGHRPNTTASWTQQTKQLCRFSSPSPRNGGRAPQRESGNRAPSDRAGRTSMRSPDGENAEFGSEAPAQTPLYMPPSPSRTRLRQVPPQLHGLALCGRAPLIRC